MEEHEILLFFSNLNSLLNFRTQKSESVYHAWRTIGNARSDLLRNPSDWNPTFRRSKVESSKHG